jgi:hypothetical protein
MYSFIHSLPSHLLDHRALVGHRALAARANVVRFDRLAAIGQHDHLERALGRARVAKHEAAKAAIVAPRHHAERALALRAVLGRAGRLQQHALHGLLGGAQVDLERLDDLMAGGQTAPVCV